MTLIELINYHISVSVDTDTDSKGSISGECYDIGFLGEDHVYKCDYYIVNNEVEITNLETSVDIDNTDLMEGVLESIQHDIIDHESEVFKDTILQPTIVYYSGKTWYRIDKHFHWGILS